MIGHAVYAYGVSKAHGYKAAVAGWGGKDVLKVACGDKRGKSRKRLDVAAVMALHLDGR